MTLKTLPFADFKTNMEETRSSFLGNITNFDNIGPRVTNFPYLIPRMNIFISYPEQIVSFYVRGQKQMGISDWRG